ncbi:hypothetical protein IPG36_08110 [bacterium]|nr:MAG: hypothetical protein IPG36_08110 [bacterium]
MQPHNRASEPYQSLLDSAARALADGDYKVAVILSQTAIEVYTEKILGQLYRQRGIAYLKPEFENLLINYNLGNTKVSGLYMALSGDDINQQPFWKDFTDHVRLRNDLVHDGADASVEQATASLAVVNQVIAHIAATFVRPATR